MNDKFSIIVEAATGQARRQLEDLGRSVDSSFDRARVSAVKFEAGVTKAWRSAKSAWVEIGAVVLSAQQAYDMAFQAARFAEREQAFANLAASHGVNAGQIIDSLKEMSAQTVDTMTLMEKAGTAMSMGIPAEKLVELMEIARASAKITGQEVSQAFGDLSLAVARGSAQILDNLGIIIKVGEANQQYAAQIGRTVEELTEAEKKQAFLNAAIEAGGQIVARAGTSATTAAEKFQSFQAGWADMQVNIGKGVLTTVRGVESQIAAVVSSITYVVEHGAGSLAWFFEAIDKLPFTEFGGIAESLRGVEDWSKATRTGGMAYMADAWDSVALIWTEAEGRAGALNQRITDQGDAADDAAGKVSKWTDEQERAFKTIARLADLTDHEARMHGARGHKATAKEQWELVEKPLLDMRVKRLNAEFSELERIMAAEGAMNSEHGAAVLEVYEARWKRQQEIQAQSSRHMIELSERTADAMENAFSGLFFDAMRGEFRDLADYADAAMRTVQQIIADYMGQMAKEWLFGASGKGGGGVLSGLVSGGIPLFSALFGGGSLAGVQQAAHGTGAMTAVGGFAMAGGGVIAEPVAGVGLRSGASYAFGEGGSPELVMPLDRLAGRSPQVIVNNYAGVGVEARLSGQDVELILTAVANDMTKGGRTARGVVSAAARDLRGNSVLRGAIRNTTR